MHTYQPTTHKAMPCARFTCAFIALISLRDAAGVIYSAEGHGLQRMFVLLGGRRTSFGTG